MSTTREYINACLEEMKEQFNLTTDECNYWEEELLEIAFKGKLDGIISEKERLTLFKA